MAKHPTSSRVHREDHGPDDAFVSAVKRSYAWSTENSRVVITAIALVILLGGGTIWYLSQQRQMENQAITRFNEVQQTIQSGNTQLAIRDLRSYLDTFGGTRAGDQARLTLANILIAEDQAEEAIEVLEGVSADLDEPYGLAGARLQAVAYEELGNVDMAVRTYERVASNARFAFERREALADAARARHEAGEPEHAARLYERVVATFEENEAGRGYYEMWLAEARAEAEQGAGTTPTTDTTASAASDNG